MPSISPTANLWAPAPAAKRSSTCSTMARPMGTIITAVAVLEIHIDRNPAATMKPSTMRAGPPPTWWMMARAMRRCRFHFCMVTAIMKPPMKSTMVLFMNVSAVSRPDITPSSGNAANGTSAVAKSGMASVIHQIAIIAATAAKRLAGGLSAATGNSVSSANATTPRTRPAVLMFSRGIGTGRRAG